jgi:hypothetical protein
MRADRPRGFAKFAVAGVRGELRRERPKARSLLIFWYRVQLKPLLLKGKTCAFNRYPPSPPLLRSWARQVRRRWDRSLLPSRAISLSEASTSTRRTAR